MNRRQFLGSAVAMSMTAQAVAGSAIDIPGAPHRAVLLPGNGLCADFYRPLGQALADRGVGTRLLTFPGYGGVPSLSEPRFAGLVDSIEPQVKQFLEPGGVLIGHSLGGLVAALLAARNSVELGGLVLMEPGIVPWPWLARWASKRYGRKEGRRAPDTFDNKGPMYRRLHDPDSFPPEAMAAAMACSVSTDRNQLKGLMADYGEIQPIGLGDISVPTLLLRGGSSGPVMRWAQRAIAKRIPEATIDVLPDAGHWMANEQDEAAAKRIVEFASAIPTR
jgi:pimeloyl-ACP methyl ester carboxylesterase